MEFFPPTFIVPSLSTLESFTANIPTAPSFSPLIPDFSTFTVAPLFTFASPQFMNSPTAPAPSSVLSADTVDPYAE